MNTIICAICGDCAEQQHHIQYQSEGGSDDEQNLMPLCRECHVWYHSARGDFKRWGAMGGQKTAESRKSFKNLKQFQGREGARRLKRWKQNN